MPNQQVPIIFDNSRSRTTKAGFAGDDGPRTRFMTAVGRRKNYGICTLGSRGLKDVYVGDEVDDASIQRNQLIVRYPIDDGVVTNWDDMEHVWDHAFRELKVEPKEHPLFITDRFIPPPGKGNREMTTQIAFETFEVPCLYTCYAEILSMYMHACSDDGLTGIRIHSNDTSTSIIPIMDSLVLEHAATRHYIGGRDITGSLQALLSHKGYEVDKATAQDIKHELCYIAFNPSTESDPSLTWINQPHRLPDGRIISVGEERFRLTEAIFNSNPIPGFPNEAHNNNLHEAISGVISQCDKTIRNRLLRNMYFSGGNTRFPGYGRRLARELGKLTPPEDWPPEWEINVSSKPDEKDAAWIGGSILASQSTFDQMWIRKEEYDEVGPAIVKRKCL